MEHGERLMQTLASLSLGKSIQEPIANTKQATFIENLSAYLQENQVFEQVLKFPMNGISINETIPETKDQILILAKELKLHVVILEETQTQLIVLLRKMLNDPLDFVEMRVAVIGNVDAGKSTMLGVLTKGVLDDGRGKARLELFRHKHEIETGRTSSIGQEILGLKIEGSVVNVANQGHKLNWEEICLQSFKVLTFLDLAGHEKYLKTTMFGLTGCAPDYAMLMVGSNAGMIGMSKEHLALAFAVNVPVFIVVTKIDMCPESVLDQTIQQLVKILKSNSCKRVPILIKDTSDILLTIKGLTDKICPIFQVSNVSGVGIPLLRTFLNLLPISTKYKKEDPFEFNITDTYLVPGVGTVVAGTVIGGQVGQGQTVLFGPDSNGNFNPVTLKGIHRKRIPVDQVKAGECASFALKKVKRAAIKKGMSLVSKEFFSNNLVGSVWEFEAEVLILFHSTTISHKYQAVLHCGVIRQTVLIVHLENRDLLRTGDRAIVRFRFLTHPELLKVGSKLLFREGRTKGVGRITRLCPMEPITK